MLTVVLMCAEVINAHSNPIPPQQLGMVQFQTTYVNGAGVRVLRVTTAARGWADPSRYAIIVVVVVVVRYLQCRP
jgi:hypothetical protein